MMNITRALNVIPDKNNRMMRALTGLSPKEFKDLVSKFRGAWHKCPMDKYFKEIKKRLRRPGGGKTGDLKTNEEKLFFILFYYKCYPTLDVLAFLYNWNKSNACRRVKQFSDILEIALGKAMVLPQR